MQEIEVGEYVRTKFGEITRIEEGKTASGRYFYAKDEIFDGVEKSNCIRWSSIVKHSKNILDLIEVGDYVNGSRVIREEYGEDDCDLFLKLQGDTHDYVLCSENQIKSIVTHEQFESIEYKI